MHFRIGNAAHARVAGAHAHARGLEDLRFALPADRITEVAVAPGPPGWIATRVVRIRWRDDAGEARWLRLTPFAGGGLHRIAERSRQLAAAIEAGHATGFAATWNERALPPGTEVTCSHPRAIACFGALLQMAMLDCVAGVAICLALGLPLLPFAGPGFLEIVLVALATKFFLLLPAARYRDSVEAATAPREQRAAA